MRLRYVASLAVVALGLASAAQSQILIAFGQQATLDDFKAASADCGIA